MNSALLVKFALMQIICFKKCCCKIFFYKLISNYEINIRPTIILAPYRYCIWLYLSININNGITGNARFFQYLYIATK